MSRVRTSRRSLALPAEELPSVRLDVTSQSTKVLQQKCDEYFALLDQLNPPECLLADYEAACDELMRRRITPEVISTLP